MKCLICGSEEQISLIEDETIQHKEQQLVVPMAFTRCAGCGYEYVPASQIKENDMAVLAAKRMADGLLTPQQIFEARVALGLTQSEAANLLGGGRNAFSKYERGEVAQSEAMDRLIRLCSRYPVLLQDLKRQCARTAAEQDNVIPLMKWRTEKNDSSVVRGGRLSVRSSMQVEQQEFANEA